MQNNMMKQMQKKLQEQMQKMQEDLAAQTVEGIAGNGMVKVTMNGQQEVQGVKIDPSVVDPGDVEMLEDLLTVAIKDAVSKSQEAGAQKISQLTGGLKIPGLF